MPYTQIGDLERRIESVIAQEETSAAKAKLLRAIFNRLATIPAVCRSGSLKKTLMVRQNGIAASEFTA